MEVEVTGTPIPDLYWYKDERPLEQEMKSPYKIEQFGNCYRLTAENGRAFFQLIKNLSKISFLLLF